jgi:hypothetical protein
MTGSGPNPPSANGLANGLTLGRLRGVSLSKGAAPVPNRWPSTIPYALHRSGLEVFVSWSVV